MCSGSVGEPERFPEIIGEVLSGSARISGTPAYNSLARALSEAMHNAVQHAYENMDEIRYPLADHCRWWLAGYRHPKTREVGFIFYDQGMTIPAGLPKKWNEAISAFLSRVAVSVGRYDQSFDGQLIEFAMEIGRTVTNRAGRGWGLSEMRALVGGPYTEAQKVSEIVGEGKGSLHILSRRGSYLYTSDRGGVVGALEEIFPGTLVVWRLVGSDAVIWRDDHDDAEN